MSQTFPEWWNEYTGGRQFARDMEIARAAWFASAKLYHPEARESIIQECRTACLEIGQLAHEAAKAKDATDYVAGYQDCAVDIDDALRDLVQPQPQYGSQEK